LRNCSNCSGLSGLEQKRAEGALALPATGAFDCWSQAPASEPGRGAGHHIPLPAPRTAWKDGHLEPLTPVAHPLLLTLAPLHQNRPVHSQPIHSQCCKARHVYNMENGLLIPTLHYTCPKLVLDALSVCFHACMVLQLSKPTTHSSDAPILMVLREDVVLW
jgi:hypothetical protein